MFGLGIIVIAVIIVIALLVLFSFVPVGLWISAIAAGVKVYWNISRYEITSSITA